MDGKRTRLQRQYPSFQEIQLDPSGAYQKLTGNYDEEISAEDTYQKLIDTIFDEMHSYYKEHTSGQNFQYVDTPLVEAIRYGYILEIQEPTVIANPGVLVGLNSLLDRCNSVYLPNGETIHRHPDTTIVITTNNDYAGCKQMNQSVISRMNLVIDLDEPDEDTQVERAMAVTGCKDAKRYVCDTHCQIHGCLLPGKSHYRWLLWHEGADFLGAVLHGLRGYPGSGPLHGACLCLCRC